MIGLLGYGKSRNQDYYGQRDYLTQLLIDLHAFIELQKTKLMFITMDFLELHTNLVTLENITVLVMCKVSINR